MLSAPSDEEKFVALSIIPKLLQSHDTEAIKRTFDKMPFKFISRLLHATQSAESLPSESLQSIAIQIVHCFCLVDLLCARPALLKIVPLLTAAIPTQNRRNKQTILQCLFRISATSAGHEALLQDRVLKPIASLAKSSDPNVSELAAELIKLIYSKYGISQTLSDCILAELAPTFKADQGLLKFQLLRLFVRVLTATDVQKSDPTPWAMDVKSGLKDILTSKTSHQDRTSSLFITSILTRRFSPEWLLRQSTPSTQSFGALVVHLACAEVRILLDSIDLTASLSLPSATNMITDTITDPLSSRRDHQQERHCANWEECRRILPMCYDLFISAILFLVSESNQATLSLSADLILSLGKAMSETGVAMGAFLTDVWETYQTHKSKIIIDNDITLFTLQALSIWLTEETAVLPSQITSIQPLILEVIQQYTAGDLSSLPINPLSFLSPFLASITSFSDEEPQTEHSKPV
ncbi:hypothetical protein SeLEV6574_g02398 [Synchytrium endobioticum]|nr:hypothetical protein SeLEV6574_g02398 [Synchytrium endobioticum]